MAQPLAFWDQQSSGLEELAGASPFAVNVVVDVETKTVRRRPALAPLAGVTSETLIDGYAITGVYRTLGGKIYAVVNDQPARTIYWVGDGARKLTALGTTTLVGTKRPMFAETEMLLVIAGGAEPQKLTLSTELLDRLGGSPPLASHVVANANRLAANDLVVDTTKVRYSGISQGTVTNSGHETWTGLDATSGSFAGFFTAEARPDPVVALHENTNELFVFGSGTLEIYGPDAQFVYTRVAAREVGCSAPYSIVKFDQQFAWLDDKRRFVMSDGRSVDYISGPIDATLDELTTVSDCFGYRVLTGNLDALVWTFPSDGRTLVFQKGAGWGQWQSRTASNWAQFPVTACHFDGNDVIVGTSDGRVCTLDPNASTDIDGQVIVARVATGYLDRGTSMRKHCQRVTLKLRRGKSDTGGGGFLYWRDQPGPWEGPLEFTLGDTTDTFVQVPFRSLGIYRERQWMLEFSGTGELVLVGADEEFEVLQEN